MGSERPVALITGGSRGIGAATAFAFADRGYNVAVTYRNKGTRAEGVVDRLLGRGVRALALRCDMTRRDEVDHLYSTLWEWAGRLDVLVLNASGGMEADLVAADPDYPRRINRDAQLAMVDGALPLMRPGGTIVFVTSHWAHLYGRVEQLPIYEPVAASKHAGEQALRDMQEQMGARDIRLLVVTGDLVAGTITPRLMERVSPGLADVRRETVGRLPGVDDMGEAIAEAAASSLPSGSTIVVGGSLDSLLG